MDNNIYLIYNELVKRLFEVKKEVIKIPCLDSDNENQKTLNNALLKLLIEENFNIYEDMCYIAYMFGGDFYGVVLDLQSDSIKTLINAYPDKAQKYKYIHKIVKSK